MEGSKEYFLKMTEQFYNQLGNDEKMYLNHLGLQVKLFKKEIAKSYENLNNYLFEKRNK
jgi:hypothetical protein